MIACVRATLEWGLAWSCRVPGCEIVALASGGRREIDSVGVEEQRMYLLCLSDLQATAGLGSKATEGEAACSVSV